MPSSLATGNCWVVMKMTRDEVMVLTHTELRIHVAEVLGATEIAWRPNDIAREAMWQFVPQGSDGDFLTGGWSVCPDYPNDLAAMGQLIDKARENDWWWSSEYKTETLSHGESDPFYRARFRCVNGGIRGDRICDGSSLPQAITRAFILAMEENHE